MGQVKLTFQLFLVVPFTVIVVGKSMPQYIVAISNRLKIQ